MCNPAIQAWAAKVQQELIAGYKYSDSEETATFFNVKLAEHKAYCKDKGIPLPTVYDKHYA
jgi:hypothetical protein